MELEDLGKLIFDPNVGEFCVAPSTSFEEMQDEIESDKEEVVGDIPHEVASVEPEHGFNGLLTDYVNDIPVSESVEPEDNFNSLVTDIMNDFGDSHDRKDSDVIIADDNDG